MRKRYLLLALGVLLMGSVQAQRLSATLNYSRFRLDSTQNLLEVYLQFDAATLRLKPDAKKQFQGKVNVAVWVQDSSRTFFADKFEMTTPTAADTLSFKKNLLNTIKRIPLPNGKFTLHLLASDPNSHDTAALRAQLPVELNFNNKNLNFSDIQLLDKYEKATAKSVIVKHGMELWPQVQGFYPAKQHQISFFVELYNATKVLGDTASFALAYAVRKNGTYKNIPELTRILYKKAQATNVFFGTLDVSNLPSGNYDLVVEIIDGNRKMLVQQSKFFQRSNPKADAGLDIAANSESVSGTNVNYGEDFTSKLKPEDLKDYLRALEPLANRQENASIIALSNGGNVVAQRKYLYDFFRRRNPESPTKAFIEYAQRIAVAEEKYSTKTMKAYETDRGRIFLKHGPPNQIENEFTDRKRTSHLEISSLPPYEVWYYYAIEERNQTNVEFAFVQTSLGNNNYKLLHSTAIGEFKNTDWRTALEKKATNSNNFDYMPVDK
ncbi:GWxTD domain-containing protein [Flexibacter flexilis DSM 6793]|uniref:GWxTD domain-containing protein n=1 Tax=Flexibacter flexilis DSM 6793 TaxID=927664 RepID=A0A1I1E9N7_9BACT|nr:GWxTD domain-containing protein [Flexibacter flexilis]SFB83787.1 GWxTD domain-containing protein [Flexibacter flexilis DSM 6793]